MRQPFGKHRKRTKGFDSPATSRFIDNVAMALLGLNRLGDRSCLEEALYRLSRMIRYIGESDRTVSLREEGAFVEHYLALQRLRFPDRLSYRIDTGADADRVAVDRFIIFSRVERVVERLIEFSPFCGTLVVDRSVLGPSTPAISISVVLPDGGVSRSPLRRCGWRGHRRLHPTGAGPFVRKRR